ncbi:hypothetical protein GCM10023336_04970 [Streptomyces similanensis]|uniref:Uncharacterized protein n=1 Tax=Streptomyces similanensis TaxID=1274988 RepID=A0ABP9JVD6_9ACTN
MIDAQSAIVTDTIGPLPAVAVTASCVRDSVAGTWLLDLVAADHPGIRKAWVDGGDVSRATTRVYPPAPRS